MEDLTIYDKYDKLLKANTDLSDENFDLYEKIERLERIKTKLELMYQKAYDEGFRNGAQAEANNY